MFMLSLCKPDQYYQVFLSQGVGMGLGTGILYMPCAGAVSNHFSKHKGLALVGAALVILFYLSSSMIGARGLSPLEAHLEALLFPLFLLIPLGEKWDLQMAFALEHLFH